MNKNKMLWIILLIFLVALPAAAQQSSPGGLPSVSEPPAQGTALPPAPGGSGVPAMPVLPGAPVENVPMPESTLLPGRVGSSDIVPHTFYPIEVQVESIQFTDAQTLVITGVQTDGCEYPLKPHWMYDEEQQALFIEIERIEMTFAPVTCTDAVLPFEVEVALDADALSNDEVSLIVHNFAGIVTTSEDAVPQIERRTSFPYMIQDFTITATDSVPAQFEIQISGIQTNGCEAPSLHQMKIELNQRVTIHTYRLVEEDAVCTQVAGDYVEKLSLGEISGVYLVSVNDVSKLYDFDRMQELMNVFESDLVIENVDTLIAESFPPQVSLLITGYHGDGCQFPIIEELSREGNTFNIHIFRRMPIDVICPAVITPYEGRISLGALNPGTYTININGTVIEVEI